MSPRTTAPAIRWADPPESATRIADPDRYAPVVEALRANPGKWAILDTVETPSQASRLTSGVKKGKFGCTPPGQFDSKSHKTADKAIDVHVRCKVAEAVTTETAEPTAAQ